MTHRHEVLISVDVETAGPIPGEFSLLSIGACVVDDTAATFSVELQPITLNADPAAMRVSGLSLQRLEESGLPPKAAMRQFADWAQGVCSPDGTPVFVGLNAPFDWSFVNYYFHRFLGSNPFGFAALDIKAYFMGVTGCSWSDTRSSRIAERLRPRTTGDHRALQDALYQAELFRLTRDLRDRLLPDSGR